MLTIVNYGLGTATGTTVTDVLPAGLTLVSISTSQGSDSFANGRVTANLGTLATNATATVTIVATVNAGVRERSDQYSHSNGRRRSTAI